MMETIEMVTINCQRLNNFGTKSKREVIANKRRRGQNGAHLLFVRSGRLVWHPNYSDNNFERNRRQKFVMRHAENWRKMTAAMKVCNMLVNTPKTISQIQGIPSKGQPDKDQSN